MGLFKYSDGLVGFNGFDSGESCSIAAELSSLEFYRDPRTGRVCMASGGVPYAMTVTEA